MAPGDRPAVSFDLLSYIWRGDDSRCSSRTAAGRRPTMSPAKFASRARIFRRPLCSASSASLCCIVSVNFIYVQVLTPAGLAATSTPASAGDAVALGSFGASLVAIAIVILRPLGFLSQAMLTYPRLYFAMADDGVLPRLLCAARCAQPCSRGRDHAARERHHRRCASRDIRTNPELRRGDGLALFWTDGERAFLFFGARSRDVERRGVPETGFRVPGHPWTTGLFTAVAWLIVLQHNLQISSQCGRCRVYSLRRGPILFLAARGAHASGRLRVND